MMRPPHADPVSLALKLVLLAGAVALGGWLLWGLRSLIVPVFVSGLLAYICRPFVIHLERHRVPRSIAIGLLLTVFVAVAFFGILGVLSSETGLLELRVRALYALNHRYQELMELDPSWTRGNRLYGFVSRDLDPLVDRLSHVLILTPEESARLVKSRPGGGDTETAQRKQLLEYERANAEVIGIRARRAGDVGSAVQEFGGARSESAATSVPWSGGLGNMLSAWIIAPLVFLFLLWDTGSLKRGLLRAVPNRLFEPTLAVLADVDQALGNYVRGVFLECCALGATVMLFIAAVGVPPRWAFAIGMLTAASNLIPYMGFAAALLSGLGCALLTEPLHPWIPFVSTETFPIWVIAAVVLAEVLKNVVYEPIILGSAVRLHPLVVVIGTVGGAILFGPPGLLLAIPTITIAKVLITSTAKHLTAYGLI
jgi:predicted PurR-regulated permease PerM